MVWCYSLGLGDIEGASLRGVFLIAPMLLRDRGSLCWDKSVVAKTTDWTTFEKFRRYSSLELQGINYEISWLTRGSGNLLS